MKRPAVIAAACLMTLTVLGQSLIPNGTLRRILDKDRDGNLSEREIADAPKTLRALDSNGDKSVSANELGVTSTEPERPRRQEGYRMPTQLFRTEVPETDINVILGAPTDHSIIFSLQSRMATGVQIKLGHQPDLLSKRLFASLKPKEAKEITLEELEPDTRYHYDIEAIDGEFETLSGTFHTARSHSSRFHFTIQADSHLDFGTVPELYERTLQNVVESESDFHIALGDTFMVDKRTRYQDAAPQYNAQRYYFSRLATSTPLFFVLGNHDGEFGYRPEMAAWSASLRTLLLPNPTADHFYSGSQDELKGIGRLENYYGWEWGNALFLCLDPFRHTKERRGSQWTKTLGKQQYDWLRRSLRESDAAFKFIFIHYLVGGLNNETRGGASIAHLHEWGGHNPKGDFEWNTMRPGWEKPIHDLLRENGPVIVFHGHDHLYAMEEKDGVIYQAVPQPAHQRFGNTRTATEYGYGNAVVRGSSGHIEVEVDSERTTVRYRHAFLPGQEQGGSQNGSISHQYSIDAR